MQFGGAFTASFMALAIFLVARNNDRADILLAWLLFLISVVLLRTGISVSGLMANYPHQLGVLFPLTYLIGPLLLIFLRAKLLDQAFRLKNVWPHFLPTLGGYLLMIPVFLLPVEKKLTYIALTFQPRSLQRAFEAFPLSSSINLLQLFTVWGVVATYALVSWRTVSNMSDEPLKPERNQARHWVAFLSFGLMAASFMAVVSLVGILFFDAVFLSPVLMMSYLSFVIIAGYSAVQLVLRPELLHPDTQKQSTDEEFPAPGQNQSGKKYEHSGLSHDDAHALSIRLQRLMEEEALYRRHDLTLQILAEHLNCTPKHLSQVLNEKICENFYEFINRYRVDEVKIQLTKNGLKKLPIIDMALNAGFNNKPAFYNAFRKNTGMTPTEYTNNKV